MFREYSKIAFLFLCIHSSFVWSTSNTGFEMRDDGAAPVAARLTFSGQASGGELELSNKSRSPELIIRVKTEANETPDTVSKKIAAELIHCPLDRFMAATVNVFSKRDAMYYQRLWEREGVIVLDGFSGEFVLGGTETSLGIQPPVGSLSASFNREEDLIEFSWHENGSYDEIVVCRLGLAGKIASSRFDEGSQSASGKVGVSTRIHKKFSRIPYYVVAYWNGLPTNASYIVVERRGQSDYFFAPFSNGIASNWTGWVAGEIEQCEFKSVGYSELGSSGSGVPRFGELDQQAQLIRTHQINVHSGLYRFFIAQSPGHTFRPSIRYQVLEEEEDFSTEWSLDVMVGAIDVERSYELDEATRIRQADAWSDLETSATQLRTWHVDHTTTNSGEWIVSETGAADSQNPQKDITLDEEKTAIFICVRLTGHKPNGIAMDSVSLTDVTEEK